MRAPRRVLLTGAVAVPLALAFAAPALAAPTTSGNLIVERVGVGATALSSSATAVFLEERQSIDGAIPGAMVQLFQPSVGPPGTNPLTTSGSATSEGQITNSADGAFVLIPGYATSPGAASVAGTTASTIPRVIDRLDANGTLDTSTTITNAFNANNIRSASSKDGSVITSVGGNSGVQSEPLGASTSTPGSTGTGNLRVIHEFGTAEFVSSSSGATIGISSVVGSTYTPLPGVPTTGTSYYGFALLRTGSGPTYGTTGADTLYVADDSAGLAKFVWNGSAFAAAGTVATPIRGLAARVGAGGTQVYATSADGTKLLEITDGGTLTGSFTTLATASSNTVFRSVAFAPQAPPAADLPEASLALLFPLAGVGIAGAVVVGRRRRRA